MLLSLFASKLTIAIDNGYGVTPPRGWRSWNQFAALNNDTVMRAQMRAVADKSRNVHGKPTSLADLGFSWISMDDGWQKCNCSTPGSPDAGLPQCPNCKATGACSWHDPTTGAPLVDIRKFPNMSDLVAYGHGLGLKVGGYMNNCICMEGGDPPMGKHCTGVPHYENDVKFLVDNKFDGVKIDNCGPAHNVTRWAELLNASGRPMRIESCHTFHPNNNTPSGWPNFPVWDPRSSEKDHTCPMNLYRSGGDIAPSFDSAIGEMYAMVQYSDRPDPFNHPGCWSYPDMQEIGNFKGAEPLRSDEEHSHWGLWCISSSPLVLGTDLSNATIMDRIWPTISNPEALAVNDAWFEKPGTLVRSYLSTGNAVTYTADHAPCNAIPPSAIAKGWSLDVESGALSIAAPVTGTAAAVDYSYTPRTLCLGTLLAPSGQKLQYDGCPPPTTHFPSHGCGVLLGECASIKGKWAHNVSRGTLAFNASNAKATDKPKCLNAKPSKPVGGFYGGPMPQSTAMGGCKTTPDGVSTFAFSKNGELIAGTGECVIARPLYGPQLWAKPVGKSKIAAFVLNLIVDAQSFALPLADVPGLTACSVGTYGVRDVWNQKDLPDVPAVKGASIAMELRGHQSSFYIITDCVGRRGGEGEGSRA